MHPTAKRGILDERQHIKLSVMAASDDDKVQGRAEGTVEDAESAISMILLAEADAREEIARAEEEEAAIIETARRRAADILARATERISRLHAASTERQRRDIQQMLEEPARGDQTPPLPDAHQLEILQAAVESLAADLSEGSQT